MYLLILVLKKFARFPIRIKAKTLSSKYVCYLKGNSANIIIFAQHIKHFKRKVKNLEVKENKIEPSLFVKV